MKHPSTKRTLMAALLSVGLVGAVGCGEDDPEATDTSNMTSSNTTSSNTTSSNTTSSNTTVGGLTCESACSMLAMCDPIGNECPDMVASGIEGDCATACAADPGVFLGAVDSLGECADYAPILADRLGSGEVCMFGDCMPAASDYSPGVQDEWPECIADSNTYSQIEMVISSIGRIAAFEEMAPLLWENPNTPTVDDFLDAREKYAVDEGLDSRVQRREDEHYPPVSDGMGGTLRCRDEGVPAMDPKRCVGPALILPIINDSFQKGATGEDPEINAARIEAALLWFFYVSSYKEAITCTGTKKDCDSAYAYYTGGEPRESGFGLAKEVRKSSKWAHDRVWDGILAVRCWRDLDSGDEAMDLETRDRAVAQMDKAQLYGFSRVVEDRLLAMSVSEGVARQAHWAGIQILGPVLDREMMERNSAVATELAAFFASDSVTNEDIAGAVKSLRSVFTCP